MEMAVVNPKLKKIWMNLGITGMWMILKTMMSIMAILTWRHLHKFRVHDPI